MLYGNYMQKNIKQIYGPCANMPNSHDASHWGSKETQVANFEQVSELLSHTEATSVLDVGSGLGSIRSYLEPEIVTYRGIDITPQIVARANDPDITEADIIDYVPTEEFDAVIALGSFNMGVPQDVVLQTLDKMIEIAKVIAIVTISYTTEDTLDKLKERGWSVINNPYRFEKGYGDWQVLVKYKE